MKIRIVTDEYSGYEVQVWRWWFPIWMQHGFTNTHSTVERAERYAKAITCKRVVKIIEE